MTLKTLLPNCKLKVAKKEFNDNSQGFYDYEYNILYINPKFREKFPTESFLFLIKSIVHSTVVEERTNRIERLQTAFGEYKLDSNSFKVEELISTLAAIVIAKELKLFDVKSRLFLFSILEKYNDEGLFIPWREVVSAVNYFSGSEDTFKGGLSFVKTYSTFKFGMNIKDSYV